MDYLPLTDEETARRNCRKAACSGKFMEPLLWVWAIGMIVVLLFRPVAVQEPATRATAMDAVLAPHVHAYPTATITMSHAPTATEAARVDAPEGCFKLSREACCSHNDGRDDHWGGWACVPAAPGKTFISGNVCEPLLAAVGPIGSCSVVNTQAGAEADLARMMAEQEERATDMDAKEEHLLMAEQALREKMNQMKFDEETDVPLERLSQELKEAQAKAEPKEQAKPKTEEELKQDLREELKLGAKLKAEQGGRLHGLGCALITKMNQTCSLPEEAQEIAKPFATAAAGTCGADCLKECNTESPGHEEYCRSTCANYCLDAGCSLSKEKIEQKIGTTEDMESYFGNLEGSAACKAADEPAMEKSTNKHLKSAPDGCFKLSREECCQYKDGRADRWGGYECVPAASGEKFFTGNVCEPALAAVGPLGSCPAQASAAKSSKITLGSTKM